MIKRETPYFVTIIQTRRQRIAVRQCLYLETVAGAGLGKKEFHSSVTINVWVSSF
jgi:hypothetical protein